MKTTGHISRLLIVPALVLGFALAGCEGDDGAAGPAGAAGPPGPQGPPGPPGPTATVDITDAGVIDPTITGVTVASPAVVNFSLVDGNGAGIVGLPAGSISFTIAKLVPGSNGNSSEWQSYITRVESPGGVGPGMQDETQASTENGSNGVLVDNMDGTYVYTFATDLANAAVPFDATATHRVGFEIRGFVPTESNGSFTFRPDSMPVSFTREIVKIDNCNACHNKLALHGNARFDAQYCMTCHNPGSIDANSTNTVDAKVMIHKIHRGANLPDLVNIGDKYSIYGFRDSEHIYGEAVDDGMGGVETEGVHLPMDIRNCRNCHDENDPDTPDAINWLTVPTMEACGSCHADVNFATGLNHSPANIAQMDNTNCTLCHGPGGGVGPIDASHEILEQTAAERYQYNIISVTDPMGGPVDPGDFPMVTFSVTDPTNNDQPYDILADAPFQPAGGARRVAIDIGWDTTDYTNTGSGSEVPGFRPGSPAQVVSLNALTASVDNMDGTFSATSTVAIPMSVTGSGLVAIEGHPAEDVNLDMTDERIPVTGATDFFPITDATAVPRRNVVALGNCLNCHQQLSLHGNNRTDNINLCVGCHNPNATDIRARQERLNADPMFVFPDGNDEVSIDFKRMIHRIHAANVIVFGFGGGEHDYTHVEFPGELNNCENCHDGDTFFPVGTSVLATTIDSGADLGDPLDDVNITPNAAVCSSCHTGALDTEHMRQNGGAFDAMQQADGTLISMSAGTVVETCDVCHAEDRIADVEVMHDFE